MRAERSTTRKGLPPAWKWPVLTAVILALLSLGLWLYSTLSEVGLNAFFTPAPSGAPATTVRLKAQAVYKVKKKLDLLGVKVIRVISKQQPQEFLIVDGVSDRLVDRVFAQKPDLAWANLIANQFVKLREAGDGDASPVSVEIQSLKTTHAGEITQGKRKLPYWQVDIRFKLSNESGARDYQAGVVRNAGSPAEKSGKETLLVGYAAKDAYQKKLMADLMNNLTYSQN